MLGLRGRGKRLKAVVGRVAAEVAHASHGGDVRRREAIQAKLKEIQRKHSRKGFDLRSALAQAGMDVPASRFTFTSVLCGAAGALFGLLLSPFFALCAALVGGLGLPRLMLAFLIRRRLAQFLSQFPEALDIVIRSVRSGLPLGESLHIIGREMREPIGPEFRMVTEGIRLGLTIEESLQVNHIVAYFGSPLGLKSASGHD